jgi:hypothetical protein
MGARITQEIFEYTDDGGTEAEARVTQVFLEYIEDTAPTSGGSHGMLTLIG